MRKTKKAFGYTYYTKFKCKHCKKWYSPDKINEDKECVNCEDETGAMGGEEIKGWLSGCLIMIMIILLIFSVITFTGVMGYLLVSNNI